MQIVYKTARFDYKHQSAKLMLFNLGLTEFEATFRLLSEVGVAYSSFVRD